MRIEKKSAESGSGDGLLSLSEAMSQGCDGCETCPFTVSEASEQAQNYGCLPSPGEILELARVTGRAWACHDDETRVCRGYASVACRTGLPVRGELNTLNTLTMLEAGLCTVPRVAEAA